MHTPAVNTSARVKFYMISRWKNVYQKYIETNLELGKYADIKF